MGFVMAGYSITYGSTPLYVPGSDVYAVSDVRLKAVDSNISTLTFAVPPTHPMYGGLIFRDQVDLVQMDYDGQLLFEGYVSDIAQTIEFQDEITCKSEIALLGDVHIRLSDLSEGYGYRAANSSIGMSARELFTNTVAAYNAKVGSSKRFVIGHNIGENAVGRQIVRARKSVEYNTQSPVTALDVLRRFICEPYGCRLKVWRSGGMRYIGLYVGAPDDSTQIIRFQENMTSFEMHTSEDDFYTGIYPVGGNATDYSNASNVDVFHLTRPLDDSSDVRGAWMYIDAPYKYSHAHIVADGEEDVRIDIGDIFVVDGISFKAMNFYIDGYVPVFPVDTTDEDVSTEPPHDIPTGTAVYYKGHSPRNRETHTVTLYDVPDGASGEYTVSGPILYHTQSVARYGLRTFTYTDELFYPEQLLESAKTRLAEHIEPATHITVDAVDMAFYRPGYTHLLAGQRVQVVHEPYGIGMYLQVTEMLINLDNPGSTKHELGAIRSAASRSLRQNADDISALRGDLATAKRDVIPAASVWRLA